MQTFIIRLGLRNIRRQKVRFSGLGICIFLFTLAFAAVWNISYAVDEQILIAKKQIMDVEHETMVQGDGEWIAQQSGDYIENISNPLFIVTVCIRLLIMVLGLGAFALIFALLYMILTERTSELKLYQLLGVTTNGVFLLVLTEAVCVTLPVYFISNIGGLIMIHLLRPWVLAGFGLSFPAISIQIGQGWRSLPLFLIAEILAGIFYLCNRKLF